MAKKQPKYCSRCPKLIEESRKGQYYCKSCNAEYMRERTKKVFTFNQISKAFNRNSMNREDFLNVLRK